MPKDFQISGAPVPLNISGVTYRARTLTDKDYDELSAWVRYRFMEDAKSSIDSMSLIKEERQEMLTAAMLASSQVTFNSVEGSKIINTNTRGVARVGWQMIHHYHPGISIEEFLEKVTDCGSEDKIIESIREINRVFIDMNIGSTDDEESESEEDSDKEPKSA